MTIALIRFFTRLISLHFIDGGMAHMIAPFKMPDFMVQHFPLFGGAQCAVDVNGRKTIFVYTDRPLDVAGESYLIDAEISFFDQFSPFFGCQ